MHPTLVSLSLLASAASAFPTLHFNSRQVPVRPCSSGVHVIAAGGDGFENIGKYGLIGTLATGILNAIPDSTNVTLPYPKADPSGLVKVKVGAENLVNYINDYHNACPDTKIVLLGYSAGAIITSNVLCGPSGPFGTGAPFDPSLSDTIIATILYGDLTFVAGQPYNVGTCTKSGRFPRTNSESCSAYSDHFQSYCDDNDPQCCSPGFDPDIHFQYPARYDGAAIQYVVGRFQESGGATSGGAPVPSDPETQDPDTPDQPGPSDNEPTPDDQDPSNDAPAPVPEVVPCPEGSHDPAPAPAPAPIPLPVPAPAPPVYTNPPSGGNNGNGKHCPVDLNGAFEFPHLIVPVSKSSPDKAYGTSFNGKVDGDISSIFNFDIPFDLSGKTCTLVFFLPEKSQLTTSSYEVSGNGGFSVGALDGPALESTTYNSVPKVVKDYGAFEINPGQSGVIASGPCAAGQRIGYKVSAEGDYALDYFQNMAQPPIGLYVRVC